MQLDNLSPDQISSMLLDSRQRIMDLVANLDDQQMLGPKLPIVNPLIWEIGHIAWFQERWALRLLRGADPVRDDGDALFNSAEVPHDTRWTLPLPSREGIQVYMDNVLGKILENLSKEPDPLPNRVAYLHLIPIFHEDMHGEAFAYTRQTLAYPAPNLKGIATSDQAPIGEGRGDAGDICMAGGDFLLGAVPDGRFAFDNEKWSHPVSVEPFSIARLATTQGEFLNFVMDQGYERQDLWSDEGWHWRLEQEAECPVYWREVEGRWEVRVFDQWWPLNENLPVLHVNWFEADAYCRWAKRRLPTESEWELAASCGPDKDAGMAGKSCYPWGDDEPGPGKANLDGMGGGRREVSTLGEGDSSPGCRQMIGNVWEWTATTFEPFPAFSMDPYKQYSEPFFGSQKVLRGGCWWTRSRLINNTYRNYYTPDRQDVWAGFRTCALTVE
jgi:iron(II)-dependent oxidoreductase